MDKNFGLRPGASSRRGDLGLNHAFMIDLDGTILRLGTDWLSVVRRLNYLYSSYELFAENSEVRGVKNLVEVQDLGIFSSIRKLKEILSDDQGLLDEVLPRVLRVLDNEESKGAPNSILCKGSADLLNFLKGYPLVLVSSNCKKAANESLISKGIETGIFAGMVTRDDVQNIKPHPEPLIKAIDLLKEKDSQAGSFVYIGDNADDIRAVRNLKKERNDLPVKMISVGGGATSRKKLKELKPDHYADDLKGVLKIVRRIAVGK